MTNQAAQHGMSVNCAHCGWGSVPVGPDGGYVCPQCFHTEEPPPALHRRAKPTPERQTATDEGPDTPVLGS